MFEDACNALDQKRNGMDQMMDQMRRRKRIVDPTMQNDFLKALIETGLFDQNLQAENELEES